MIRSTLDKPTRYETRSVLAGAYRGSKLEHRPTCTHVVRLVDGELDEVLCNPRGAGRGRVLADNLVDEYGMTPAELDGPATCPTCRARDPREFGTAENNDGGSIDGTTRIV